MKGWVITMAGRRRRRVSLGTIVMLLLTALYLLFAPQIVSMFMQNEQIIEYGAAFMRGLSLAQPFLCMDFMAVGVFQACGMGSRALLFAFLRKIALECAEGTGLRVHEGVYMFFTGPQFETPAEIRAIRILGGDAVGMSTVTEALTAAHCGMPCLAFSVITNMAAGMLKEALSDEEVNEVGKKVGERFSAYLMRVLEKM